MAKKNTLGAFIFHIHRPDTIRVSALSEQAYSTFFRSIEDSAASNITFQIEQIALSPTMIMDLVKAFKRVLSAERKLKCHILLIEMLDDETDVDVYDNICNGINLALSVQNTIMPWCIGITVSNYDIFEESVLLKHNLIPTCKKNDIGLILLSDDQNFKPVILNQGNLPKMTEFPILQLSKPEKEKNNEIEKRLSTEEITKTFQVLFGHFQINVDNRSYHLPAIASVKKLAENSIFLSQLRYDITQMLNSFTFQVLHFGIPGGGIYELSFNLVEGDVNRLNNTGNTRRAYDSPVLLLYDFLSPMYLIDNTIREVKKNGATQIAVAGIARCEDTPNFNEIPSVYYIDANYMKILNGDSECRFCNQGVPVIDEEYFDNFARKIEEFDAFTFWEFIAQNNNFYKVGHWPSDRTPNHYHFRILTEPIFKQHGFGLAIRLRNLLEKKGIISSWIQKIVCTDEESYILSLYLSEVLRLSYNDVIRIPRSFSGSIAGKELDPSLLDYIDKNYGKDPLKQQNVIIIDQAAHHFKTLSALRDICSYYDDCTIFAFAVFIDRTDPAFSVGEYLHDSHYIALYSWPVPPRIKYECPCVEN